MLRKHFENVSHILSLTKTKRTLEFEKLRRKAIEKENLKLGEQGVHYSQFIRERKTKSESCDKLVKCNHCLSFLAKKNISRHKCNSFHEVISPSFTMY